MAVSLQPLERAGSAEPEEGLSPQQPANLWMRLNLKRQAGALSAELGSWVVVGALVLQPDIPSDRIGLSPDLQSSLGQLRQFDTLLLYRVGQLGQATMLCRTCIMKANGLQYEG